MVTPTPSQIKIRNHLSRDLLVIAPAGCGKTEALALRIDGLLQRGDVELPRKILVVTFSNRAKDNIRDRLRTYLGVKHLRDHVTVVNFHGLSARIFKAHANVIGLDPSMTLPESDWVREECNRRGLKYPTAKRAQDALRVAKLEPRTDADIDDYLLRNHEINALEIERKRVADCRLTYDDLPRVAELILEDDRVANLYREHFGAVIVDEFQDLTPQQLQIVNRIGYRRTTYAGDLAQGIYGFTGAKPTEVHRLISEECTETVVFTESHRSSPAVLAAVNSLIPLTGGTPLTSADEASWPGGGLFATAEFPSAEGEADWVTYLARRLASKVPHHRIGIMARTEKRRKFVESALDDAGVNYMRWDDGVLDTDTAQVMRSMLNHFNLEAYKRAENQISFLRESSGLKEISEPSTRQSLVSALEWCYELLRNGIPPEEIRTRIKIGNGDTLVSKPGVHVLNGHVGKGQQFDWVMIVGAEDESIPFYLAKTEEAQREEARILSVMISRARHGVFITYANSVKLTPKWCKPCKPSPYFNQLSRANPLGGRHIWDWLRNADWSAIAAK
ncbi:UvrD-helicase domain-containing protein [Dermabacteraceae bacterium CCM 9519]